MWFFGTRSEPITPVTDYELPPSSAQQSPYAQTPLLTPVQGGGTIATIEEGHNYYECDVQQEIGDRTGSFPLAVLQPNVTHIFGIEVPANMQKAQFVVNTVPQKPANKYAVIGGCLCVLCCVGIVVALVVSLIISAINFGSGWYTVAIYSDSACANPLVEVAYPTNECITLYNVTAGHSSIKFQSSKSDKQVRKYKYLDGFCGGGPAVDTGVDGTGHACVVNPYTGSNYIKVFLKQNKWTSIFAVDQPTFSNNGFSSYPFPTIPTSDMGSEASAEPDAADNPGE
jgi:hypothetical protein